jgi:hypothetical protein
VTREPGGCCDTRRGLFARASSLAVVAALLVLSGCGRPVSDVMVGFAPGVRDLDPTAFGASAAPCSDTFFGTTATDKPESRSGYFRCWRLVASNDQASATFDQVSTELLGDQASIKRCSSPASWPMICTAYAFTGGQGPVVFLIQTTRGGDASNYDIGFGSSNVPVSQFEANL